ncbi:MAG: endonuclease [Bacteroidetes bacterium]|nr:endonuclease [Bacteroidota bacterium]
MRKTPRTKSWLSATLPILFVLLITRVFSQIPAGYYDPAAGKTGVPLQAALHNIIKGHTVISYAGLWTAYYTTDDKPNGKVWDMYSDVPNGTPNGNPPYSFTFGTDQCGNYSAEGDCYNREHSWPKSWFNDTSPMNSDIFHIYPTDGKVNGMRDNYPYGTVTSPTWTSENGCKLGTCTWPGYTGTVFEPIDTYKGDFARTYFYMSTRYYTEDSGWPGSPAVTGSQLKPWALQLMLHWSTIDPVSQKEIDRNNTAYGMQHNRNPFIDHPEYASQIWGNPVGMEDLNTLNYQLVAYPNPASERCYVDLPAGCIAGSMKLMVVSVSGMKVTPACSQTGNTLTMDIRSMPGGIYFLVLSGESGTYHAKLVKE